MLSMPPPSLIDCWHRFHKTRTPLVKWIWAIYLVSQDKGGVSAMRLSKQLELGYKTAWLMPHKIRNAMAQRDSHDPISNIMVLVSVVHITIGCGEWKHFAIDGPSKISRIS